MKSQFFVQFVLFFSIGIVLSCGTGVQTGRGPLSLEKVPQRLDIVQPVTTLPDDKAEYGIITDLDGDGVDEWVLVYFAGTDEVIDHYAIVLYEKKGNSWVLTDWLDSKDPNLPKYFLEATPDLPASVDIVPEWLAKLPSPRGMGWTGESLNLWLNSPKVALPIANLDGRAGNEVIIPLTGFNEWRLLVLTKVDGRLQILDKVEGIELKGEVR